MTRAMLLLLLLTLAAPLVSANCGFEDLYQDWQCDVCSDEVFVMDGPFGCLPINATFDNLPTGPLNGEYLNATWEGFDIVDPSTIDLLLPQIQPFSSPNYAKVPADTTATLVLHTDDGYYQSTLFGGLYSFEYACAEPVLGIPASCTVTVDGSCVLYSSGAIQPHRITTTMLYDSPDVFDTQMTYGRAQTPQPFSGPPNGVCVNLTFSAVSSIGTPVDLFLDNVIFAALLNNAV